MKTATLFLNGDPPNELSIRLANKYKPSFVLCTDGAFSYMKGIGIQPDAVIGDMDSLIERPEGIDCYLIEDQNTTDFEKALDFLVHEKFENVVVLGSTGGQNDHFLGNLNAAFKFRNQLKILFFDHSQSFQLLEKGKHVFSSHSGKIVSLIPFPRVLINEINGLKYSLKNDVLDLCERVGTRNESISDKFSIDVEEGVLWIFISY